MKLSCLLVLAACTHAAPVPTPSPPTPPTPPPAQPTPRRPPQKSAITARTITRAELGADGAVPQHAIIVARQGIAMGSQATIDLDTGIVVVTTHSMRMKEPSKHQKAIPADKLAIIVKLAALARDEVPNGNVALWSSDSYERLDLVDGDVVFEIVGNPIYIFDGDTDRPAAGNLIAAISDVTR